MYSHDCVSDHLWAQDYCYVVLELIIVIQKLLHAGKLIINCWGNFKHGNDCNYYIPSSKLLSCGYWVIMM